MAFLQRLGILVIGLALLLSLACEKHHVGEYPEVQRERMVSAGDRPTPAASPNASASPTPVNFFPEKKAP